MQTVIALLITLAEIEHVAEAKNWGYQSARIYVLFSRTKPALVLPDTETAPRAWARIKRGCESLGRPISFADAWIAAMAVQRMTPLVTQPMRERWIMKISREPVDSYGSFGAVLMDHPPHSFVRAAVQRLAQQVRSVQHVRLKDPELKTWEQFNNDMSPRT